MTHKPNLPSQKPPLGREELAFLPAALEVQDTPPSPIGRMVLWTLIGLCVSAVAWASLGKVDIVAVAPGRIVPSGRVKVIQSAGLGIVKAIHVTDGQRVRAGDVLIELDPTLAQADHHRADEELVSTELELSRQESFQVWLATGQSGPVKAKEPLASRQSPFATLQRSMLIQSVSEHRGQLALIEQTLSRRRADMEATRQQVEKLRRTLPIIAQRADSMKKIADQNLFPRTQYLELEQQRIEAVQDLATEQANLESLQFAIQELLEQRGAISAQAETKTLAEIERLNKVASALRQEGIKAAQIAAQQVLIAPVDGEVQQLALHTIGGVVEPGASIMVIVPVDTVLEVEALVLNKDIGVVRDGQPATVKIDAFPFTRYGAIDAEVTAVSDDAMQDERLGLVYNARVRLVRGEMNVDGKTVPLSPGMTVSVEVKTGHRRIADYLLSPVVQRTTESMRER